MGMSQEEIDKSFDILNEMTDGLIYIAKEMGKEKDAPVGGIPSTLFNAYQDMVAEQIDICANNLGGKSAMEYINIQRRTVDHFLGVLQGFEDEIKLVEKKSQADKKKS
ncbi:MAG: hypothetical protein V3V74_07160 [Nitrosomonadaceae bacterium]